MNDIDRLEQLFQTAENTSAINPAHLNQPPATYSVTVTTKLGKWEHYATTRTAALTLWYQYAKICNWNDTEKVTIQKTAQCEICKPNPCPLKQ